MTQRKGNQAKGKTPAKAPPKRGRGRPTAYTEAVGEEICMRLAEGESLRRICDDPKMPAFRTVIGWLMKGEPAEFSHHYAQARQLQSDVQADGMVDVAQEARLQTVTDHNGVTRVDGGAVQAIKLELEQRRWNAERLLPRKYGALIKHADHTGEAPAQFVVNMPDGD